MYAYCDRKLASARLIYIMYAYFDRKLASARPIYIIYAYVDRKLARNANEVRDSAVTHLHNDIPFQQYKYRPHVCLVTVDFNSSSEAVASLSPVRHLSCSCKEAYTVKSYVSMPSLSCHDSLGLTNRR